jgi:putative transposase
VTEFLGRDRYRRDQQARPGYRNVHAELQVKTTAGPVVLERPKLRGTDQPFASRLLGKGVSRTNALEALVLSGFVRGLSVRDVEAALGEALGPERRCRSRPSAASASRSRRSSTPGRPATCQGSSWSTCSWTAPTSGCTRALGPSRCLPPGASPPRAARCWSGWRRAATRATTLGRVPRRADRPRAAATAAGDHRRCARADRRGRAGVLAVVAAALPDPPLPQPARACAQARPG